MSAAGGPDRQRLDKWLWHARLARTRTLAQKLVTGGKVRVNKEKIVAPGTGVRTGDLITVSLERDVRVLEIIGFCERRGPASLAQTLYVDRSPPAPAEAAPGGGRHPGAERSGRPDRRARRNLRALKQFDS